ncbi:hypothetical protein PHMEG_00035510 [Phytophthora megakarya]|uniref:Uncharacterized protein n=1 Tax=Phytophthora megakarya TaxID=4795 RepID=A0A225UN81_9STRA|nr:hypothetical protein PHMEG_00035510 [Phytophthora megakarya]
MKGWISRHPAKTISDLEEKVAGSKEHIMSENWKKTYRHIQKEGNLFLRALEEADDEVELADEFVDETSECEDSIRSE